MPLDEVRRRSGMKVGVAGNVDVDLLSRGHARRRSKRPPGSSCGGFRSSGGHFLGSGNSISASVRPENYWAMVQTARRYGRYPIAA